MKEHVSWGWLKQSASEWWTTCIFTPHLHSSGTHFPSTLISQPSCSVLEPKRLDIDTEGRFQGFLPDLWGWEMSVPFKACWVIIIRAPPRILTPCPVFFFFPREKWLSKQVVHSCPGWLWSGSKHVWYFPLSPFGDQLTVSFEQTAPFWKGFYGFRMSILLFPFVPFC